MSEFNVAYTGSLHIATVGVSSAILNTVHTLHIYYTSEMLHVDTC